MSVWIVENLFENNFFFYLLNKQSVEELPILEEMMKRSWKKRFVVKYSNAKKFGPRIAYEWKRMLENVWNENESITIFPELYRRKS